MAEYERKRREPERTFTELQLARKRVEQLATLVRTEAFDDWLRRSTVPATVPAEWTPARTLYASYLNHAKIYGKNRTHRGLSQQVIATETTWGRLMATMFHKTRRTNGVYYPLKVKRGA